jgi:hypothetical protein
MLYLDGLNTDWVRTVLYHPLTPFFVLFCNIVASSNESDFQLLNVVTSQLDGLAGFSPSIAKLQTLFKAFIGLCEGLVVRENEMTSYAAENRLQPRAIERPQGFTSVPQPSNRISEEQVRLPVNMDGLVAEHETMNQPSQEIPTDFPTNNGLGMVEPGWGLFDTQPTLGWLDADFSFFDSNQ